MTKRILLVVGLGLGVVILTVVVISLLSGGGEPKTTAQPTPTEPTNLAISKAKRQYTDALEKSKDWQQNATLSRVYRKFEGTLGPSKPTPIVYAFSSLADPRTTFEVEFAGTDVTDRKVPKQSYELLFNPVDVAEWNLDSDNALRLAEENGGQEFREQHLAGFTVIQQLAKMGAHPLQWYFRYDTADGSNLRLEVYVNADTSAVDFKKQGPR